MRRGIKRSTECGGTSTEFNAINGFKNVKKMPNCLYILQHLNIILCEMEEETDRQTDEQIERASEKKEHYGASNNVVRNKTMIK